MRLRLEALCCSGFRAAYLRLHREFLDWLRPFVGTGAMAEIVRDESLMLWGFTFPLAMNLWCSFGHAEEWLTLSRRIEVELLVAAYIPTLDPSEEWQAMTIAGCLNTCAEMLYTVGQYERAWTYFERQLATEDYSYRSLIRAAATLWKVRGESARSEVVSLLQMASVRPDARPGWVLEEFGQTKELADVQNDPEFAAAATAPSVR